MIKRLFAITLVILLNSMQLAFAAEMTGDVLNNGGLGGANIVGSDGGFIGFDTNGTDANLNFNGNSTINWGNLNVENGQSLNFLNGNNTVLNNVQNGMSTFAGLVTGESGHIVISNANGMLLQGGKFTTAGDLTLTTKDAILNGSQLELTENGSMNGILITPAFGGSPSELKIGGDLTIHSVGIAIDSADITSGGDIQFITSNGADYLATSVNYADGASRANAISLSNNGAQAIKSQNGEIRVIAKDNGDININGANFAAKNTNLAAKNVTINGSLNKFDGDLTVVAGKDVNVDNVDAVGNILIGAWQYRDTNIQNIIANNLKSQNGYIFLNAKNNINANQINAKADIWAVAGNELSMKNSTGASFALGTDGTGEWQAISKKVTVDNISINGETPLIAENIWLYSQGDVIANNVNSGSSIFGVVSKGSVNASNIVANQMGVWADKNVTINNLETDALLIGDSSDNGNSLPTGQVENITLNNVNVKVYDTDLNAKNNITIGGNTNSFGGNLTANASGIDVKNIKATGDINLGVNTETWKTEANNVLADNIIANNINITASNDATLRNSTATGDIWAFGGVNTVADTLKANNIWLGYDIEYAISKSATIKDLISNNDVYVSADKISATGDVSGLNNIEMLADSLTSTGKLIAGNNIVLKAISSNGSKLNLNLAEAGDLLSVHNFEKVSANSLKSSKMLFERNKTVGLKDVVTDEIFFYDLDSSKSMDVVIDSLNSNKTASVNVNVVPSSHTEWYANTLKSLKIAKSNSNLNLGQIETAGDAIINTDKNVTMEQNNFGNDLYLTADKVALNGNVSAGRDLVIGGNNIKSNHKISAGRMVGLYSNDALPSYSNGATVDVNEVNGSTVIIGDIKTFDANKILAKELVIQDSGVVNIKNANVNDLSFAYYGYTGPVSTTINNLNAFSGDTVRINKGGWMFDSSALTDAINDLTIANSNANIDLGLISSTGKIDVNTSKNLSMNNQVGATGDFNFKANNIEVNGTLLSGDLKATAQDKITLDGTYSLSGKTNLTGKNVNVLNSSLNETTVRATEKATISSTGMAGDLKIDAKNVELGGSYVSFGNATLNALEDIIAENIYGSGNFTAKAGGNISIKDAYILNGNTNLAANNITIGGKGNVFVNDLIANADNDMVIENAMVARDLTANAGNNLSMTKVSAKNLNSTNFKNATFNNINVEDMNLSKAGNASINNSAILNTLKGENLNSLAVSNSTMTDLIANNVNQINVSNSKIVNNVNLTEFQNAVFYGSNANILYFTHGNVLKIENSTATKMINTGVNNLYYINSNAPIAYDPDEPSDRESRGEVTKTANNVMPDTVSAVAIAQSFTPIAFAADDEASSRSISSSNFMKNSVSQNKDGSISVKDTFKAIDSELSMIN